MSEPLIAGKTKHVMATDDPNVVTLEAVDRLTGGDAAKVAEIADIGQQKTQQTANVFGLLKKAGIPTAFIEQASPKSLKCRKCDMLPLEFVVRRYAFGSFLKRLTPDDPAFGAPKEAPYRFETLLSEVFHKNSVVMPPLIDAPTQMSENNARDQYLRDGAWPDGVYTDPYLDTKTTPGTWGLYSAKAPIDGAPLMTCAPLMSDADLATAINDIVLPTFSTLENAWQSVETVHGPVQLVDMKVELGRDAETGQLLLADVIDNDSWRVWPGANPANQLDKQAFRDGDSLANVAQKYALVTELTGRF